MKESRFPGGGGWHFWANTLLAQILRLGVKMPRPEDLCLFPNKGWRVECRWNVVKQFPGSCFLLPTRLCSSLLEVHGVLRNPSLDFPSDKVYTLQKTLLMIHFWFVTVKLGFPWDTLYPQQWHDPGDCITAFSSSTKTSIKTEYSCLTSTAS